MRPSPLRHTLAVHRNIIGLTQKEMAALMGRSARTVQAIELGQLPLTQELALKLEHETGVEVAWLLADNPDAPPRRGASAYGFQRLPAEHYSRRDYEIHRSWLELKPDDKPEQEIRAKSSYSMAELKAIAKANTLKLRKRTDRELATLLKQLLDATAPNTDGDLVRWKIRRSLEELAREFSLELGQARPQPPASAKPTEPVRPDPSRPL